MKLDPKLAARGDVLFQVELMHETKDAVKTQRLATLVSRAKAAMANENLAVVVFKLPR